MPISTASYIEVGLFADSYEEAWYELPFHCQQSVLAVQLAATN
jgi:hypothetical protein